MRSMTGFGVGRAPMGQGRLSVEVRSLNHRFLEVRVRMPQEATDLGFYVEQLCRDRLQRGRYDITVRLEGAAAPPNIDLARGEAAYAALCKLRDAVAPDAEVPLSLLAQVPDLMVSRALDSDAVQQAIDAALTEAIGRLDEMRKTEGQSLAKELMALLAQARVLRDRILERSPELLRLHHTRLRERVSRLVQDLALAVDPGRIEAEVALLADRSDVTEELTRLASHFEQFEDLLQDEKPVGRRLDFLLQEIGREANTIGAKSQDAPLAHTVVELKAEIERMREQVQNVE